MIKVLTKRERLIFYITAGVLVFALIFNFFLAPLLLKNNELNRAIHYQRAKIKKYLWLLSQKEAILAQNKDILQAMIPAEGQEDALVSSLSELEALAKNAGIRIVDIRPQQKSSGKEILIEARTEGDMDSYLKFIYNLENPLSLLRIKKIQLTAKPNASTLEGTFSISQLSGLE